MCGCAFIYIYIYELNVDVNEMNEFFVGVFVGCENILLPSRSFIHYLFCK